MPEDVVVAVLALEPETMTREQLEAEVWYWRTETAAKLWFGLVEYSAGGKQRGRRALGEALARGADLLAAALSGDVHDACSICGKPLIPGQAALPDVEMGDVHALCDGWADGSPVKPGDKIAMDPESIVWEGEGPKPDHLVAHEVERLYTTSQLVARVAEARAALLAVRPPWLPTGMVVRAEASAG